MTHNTDIKHEVWENDDYHHKIPLSARTRIKHEVWENDDYHIEYSTPFSASPYFSYKVLDKKTNTKSELRIGVYEECYNLDGECKLTYIQENKDPIHLSALRPSTVRRNGDSKYVEHPDQKKYTNEPRIGGHRPLHTDGFYHYVKNIDDVMSIRRALEKGDFEVDSFPIKNKEERKGTAPSYSKEEAVGSILSFMDTYIFNTDEAKEVLAEYMHNHPLPQKEEKAPQESDNTLARVRKKLSQTKVAKAAGNILAIKDIENTKMPAAYKKGEKLVSKLIDKITSRKSGR